MAFKNQPYFAVRVVLRYSDGSTAQRDYVRGHTRMGRERFTAWSLGDMLILVTEAQLDADKPAEVNLESFSVFEIDFSTVAENRTYRHTSH